MERSNPGKLSLNDNVLENMKIAVITGEANIPPSFFGASSGVLCCRNVSIINTEELEDVVLVFVFSHQDDLNEKISHITQLRRNDVKPIYAIFDRIEIIYEFLDSTNLDIDVLGFSRGVLLTQVVEQKGALSGAVEKTKLLKAVWMLQELTRQELIESNPSEDGLGKQLKNELYPRLVPLYKKTRRFMPARLRELLMTTWGRI